ncbi:amidohydrolase [Elstera cyanobacteriorum]|uniref:Amidohydrolase n=1 Tax=Elstera cyanobacteriorum TaxID=2022747 RepID=A0A255XSL3_9PROT|nr:amidohydrolase family protein [Elstera cyanobacteriorum]OYQ19354.1 amidohydrolase [Elstera cyanobacteriorum]GFZ90814.1 amidohydrolase [Elstera cyanobacteriorum]
MKIDAHHHIWQLARGDYGWLTPDLTPLYRDFGMAEVTPFLTHFGIVKVILVQAAPTEAETHYLLNVADADPRVAGVVGWTEFSAPDAPARIAALAAHPKLVGLRPMVQDIADDDWLLRADLIPAFNAVIDHGLVYDALVLPRHLPRLLTVVERHPDLTVVIDHLAKPFIADGQMEPWRADMRRLATHPNVHCKLSGMITEARAGWRVDDLRPYVETALDLFGPDRLIWGSDWPVADLAGGYAAWAEATEDLLAPLTSTEKAAIQGGTAERVYLKEGNA